jgi:hypothetical protein
MIKFYSPEDFMGDLSFFAAEKVADHANKILEERCVRVYGYKGIKVGFIMGVEYLEDMDTHESLMLPPWEIKKKECVEHSPQEILINGSWECRACGKKLKPKWELG